MLYLISLVSFLLPFQLAIHFDNFQNTVYGFRIDYLIPTLYLTDIVAILIIALGLKSFKFTRIYYVLCIMYFGFAALNIHNSLFIIPAIYKWLKVTEMLLLGIVIFNSKKFEVFNNFIKPLSYSVIIVCILGLCQFIMKGSVGGLFYWTGERSFSFSDANIAPYPYGTFSHPNSFAGFLLVFGIFLLQLKSFFKPKYFLFLAVLVVVNLILTNSLNVYITIVLLFILKYGSNLLFGFIPFSFSDRFVTHRIELIQASLQIIKDNFWFGVGFNNFIPNLVKVSNTFVNAWELQPVHNIFLLTFSETGVIGLFALCYMLYAGLTAYSLPLIAIVVTGLSDHYWLTLQQNLLLLTYVVVISKKKK